MKVLQTPLPGLLIVEPVVHGDRRGYFLETYHEARYRDVGIDEPFVQANLSRSEHGVLRGLHFQVRRPQGKLVSVLRGEVFDVAVDVRRGSPDFGRWFGLRLKDEGHRQLYIPPGFAHGFCVLSACADLSYQCTRPYDPHDEGGILWRDPEIAIEWPLDRPLLSERDTALPLLAELPADRLPSFEEAE